MSSPFPASIGRILRPGDGVAGDRVEGACFVISSRHVMTCAHVVNAALGHDGRRQTRPGGVEAIQVDFPQYSNTDESYPVSALVEWFAYRDPGDAGPQAPTADPLDPDRDTADVAVLELKTPLPEGLVPFGLRWLAEPWRQAFKSLGYHKPEGGHAVGEMLGPTQGGWIELARERDHGLFLAKGFSGAPILADTATASEVIGMVAAVETTGEDTVGYVVPVTQLERAWPPLATPYVGLQAFEEADARWFRGRDGFTADISPPW